jgi:hypothetical protein
LTPSSTPDTNATPTASPTRTPQRTGGPTPTPLFGPTQPPATGEATIVAEVNPNAPVIEYFTTDSLSVVPGSTVDLFWASRRAANAVIYRLNRQGERTTVWNVGADGRLTVQTSGNDRGQLDFILIVSREGLESQQTLSIPLECAGGWFFDPPPNECPDRAPEETRIVEQPFERGRMIYVESTNRVYVLFNDGGPPPAWISFANEYNPAIHPESEANLVPPPGFVQPIAQLGLVWRREAVRTRLGLGAAPEFAFQGFVQTANDNVFISSTNRTVIQLVPNQQAWQIITLPE